MKSTILTTLSAAVLFFFFSCNKQDVNNEKLSMNEDSNLKIAKAVSLISKVVRKLAFSMLSSSEKYILWVQHLENAKNNPNLTRQQKQLIDEAKQFISISFFEGNKSTKNKSFDIWKYRVSQHFNDKLKASVFNEIANERRDIYANNSGRPTPPVNCGCHDASDFCSRLNYTVLFCSHYFTCDTDTDCLPEDSGCGWFWAESCDGKCIEYTTGAC